MGNTGLTANLGSTNKFFMPWLIPRNDSNSVFRPNFFGKLAGRTKRDEYNDLNTIEKGKQIESYIKIMMMNRIAQKTTHIVHYFR